MASKTRIPKKVGRPTLDECGFGDYERELKNTVLRHTKPLMPAVIKGMADLAGIPSEESPELAITEDVVGDKKNVPVSPSVRLQSYKAIAELHVNALGGVYGKGYKEPKEPEGKPKLASVSKLSLSVPVQQESKED